MAIHFITSPLERFLREPCKRPTNSRLIWLQTAHGKTGKTTTEKGRLLFYGCMHLHTGPVVSFLFDPYREMFDRFPVCCWHRVSDCLATGSLPTCTTPSIYKTPESVLLYGLKTEAMSKYQMLVHHCKDTREQFSILGSAENRKLWIFFSLISIFPCAPRVLFPS